MKVTRSAKKIFSIFLTGFCFSIANAKPVSIDNAQKAAQTQISRKKNKTLKSPRGKSNALHANYSIKRAKELIDKDTRRILAYVLDLDPKGYAVISPDTDITPVIAYSFNSNFVMEDSPNNILLHMVSWDMQNRLKAVPLTSEDVKDKNNALWDKYLEGKNFLPAGAAVLAIYGPLISTTWEQSAPYNNNCPIDPDTSLRSVTGCAATSMAQIVNYFQYPGAVTFTAEDNYTTDTRGIDLSAPTANFSNMSYPVATDTGKAELSYACGVAAKMDYTSSESGTYHIYSAVAFKKKFGYFSADYKPSGVPDFYPTLQINMKNGQPAQLGISGASGGHSIVCDGYDSSAGEYHLNFGWNGASDAWYILPDGLVGFNVVLDAVLNIKPYGDGGVKLKGLKAYPNPCYFNSSYLTIAGIPAGATAPKVYIYNVAGELVKTLKEILDIPGIVPGNTAYWDGKNENNEKVASGLYIYLVKTGNYGKGSGKVYVFW